MPTHRRHNGNSIKYPNHIADLWGTAVCAFQCCFLCIYSSVFMVYINSWLRTHSTRSYDLIQVTSHPWQSMKSHYMNKILPNLESFSHGKPNGKQPRDNHTSPGNITLPYSTVHQVLGRKHNVGRPVSSQRDRL